MLEAQAVKGESSTPPVIKTLAQSVTKVASAAPFGSSYDTLAFRLIDQRRLALKEYQVELLPLERSSAAEVP